MKKFTLVVLQLSILFFIHAHANGQDTSRNAYAKQLSKIAQEFKHDGYQINNLLHDKRFEVYSNIGNQFKNSAERKIPTLDEYKKLLHFDEKKTKGEAFIDTHPKNLRKAEKKYGISRYVITAIIGIESDYGKNIGSYNPFNVYVSMIAVNYRADFAQAQLKELLAFIKRKKLDVFSLKSSYAGAISYAQFIPYSLNKWFVGKNIFSMKNNIYSIGNYLAHFKEITGTLPKAILRYNTSTLYRDFVLDLADALQKQAT